MNGTLIAKMVRLMEQRIVSCELCWFVIGYGNESTT